MRRSKNETIAEFRDDFLAGKSDDYKAKFDSRTEDQQYAAIANWKRNAKNLGDASKDLAKVTAANVMAYLKDAHKKLVNLETLTPKETQKINDMLDKFKGAVDNFALLKKQQYLKSLQAEKESLQKRSANLDEEIQKLQNELG